MNRRILAIDGGGIKGVFPAAFLASLEDALPLPIGSYFDLIVGTSTGGILALGLGAGFSAKDILRLYEAHGPAIFRNQGVLARLSQWFVAKHSASRLRRVLEKQFGERTIGDSRVRLVIPSQNLETGQVYIFKTPHHPRFTADQKESMVDAAMATAAAPTYFRAHTLPDGTGTVDGGLWANNPAGVAAVEAIGVLGWTGPQTTLISLSCTVEPPTAGAAHGRSVGRSFWAYKAIGLMLAGQSSSALGTAQLLLGRDQVIRIAPVVAPGTFALDNAAGISRLKGLGASEAREATPRLQPYLQIPAEPFGPSNP